VDAEPPVIPGDGWVAQLRSSTVTFWSLMQRCTSASRVRLQPLTAAAAAAVIRVSVTFLLFFMARFEALRL
jgi:hypothetical protein